MYDGKLTKMDADDAFTGEIASLDFDINFNMVPNPHKANDKHPDYCIEARSPRGKYIRIGSAWAGLSKAGNEYLSLAFNIANQNGPVRVNAMVEEGGDPSQYRIFPMVMAAAA